MIQKLHSLVWGPALLTLLLITGGLYTLRLKGFQILGIRTWWKHTIGSLFADAKDSREEKENILSQRLRQPVLLLPQPLEPEIL